MPKTLLLALALLLGGVPLLPSSAAVHGFTSCATADGISVCAFHCHEGQRLFAEVETPAFVFADVYAECGGVYLGCSAMGGCNQTSAMLTQSGGEGTCTTFNYGGYCRAFASVVLDGADLATPGVEEMDVATPPVAEVCAPDEVLCVGPAQPIPVVTVPGVPGQDVPVPVRVEIDYDLPAPTTQPLRDEKVGPIEVLGPPVPVTVCRTPCDAVGPRDGVVPSLTLVVTLAGTPYAVTVLP